MNKKRRRLSEKLKSKIVEQSYSKEHRIKDLAKRYGVSIVSIYGWRRAAKDIDQKATKNSIENFVELEIPESGTLEVEQGLQQIEFIYNNYSLSLKGKIDRELIPPIFIYLKVRC